MKKNSINLVLIPFLGILLAIMPGCSPEKRIQRMVKNNPHLVKSDTISVIDTQIVITERVFSDTIISVNSFRSDTIVLKKENLTVKTYVHKDSVFIEGECDTIRVETIREIAVPVDRVEVRDVQNKWVFPLIFVCAFLTSALIYSLRKNKWR